VGWYTIMIVLGVLIIISAMSSYLLNNRGNRT
jgi:hypothetical protein